MRCQTCDILLDDYEVKRKDPKTGEFWDMCNTCLGVHKQTLWELEEPKIYKEVK